MNGLFRYFNYITIYFVFLFLTTTSTHAALDVGVPTLHLAVSGEQLDRFSKAVASGQQPETTTYAYMRTLNCRTYNNRAIDTFSALSQNKECLGVGYCRFLLVEDSRAAWSCAVQGYVDNDPTLYEASAKIIRAWASRFQSMTGSDAPLAHGYSWNAMVWAADLLEATYPGFTAADASTFRDMLRARILPAVRGNGYVLNWRSWRLFAWYTVAIHLRDSAESDEARQGLLSHITSYTGRGYSMETSRDMWHAQMGIAPLAYAAETAHHNGSDALYQQDNNAIMRASEHAANIVLNYNDGDIDPVSGARLSIVNSAYSYYQLIVHHYHERLGLNTPYSENVVAARRHEWRNTYRNGVELFNVTGWGTGFYRGGKFGDKPSDLPPGGGFPPPPGGGGGIGSCYK